MEVRDALMVPNDLARLTASDEVHIDLLGSLSDIDLIWSNFQIGISKSKRTFSEPARRGEHDGVISISVSL